MHFDFFSLIIFCMKRIIFIFFLLFYTTALAIEPKYNFGRGFFLNQNIWIGGYFTLSYWKKNSQYSFKFEDIAFLTRISYKKASFFSEIESKNIYISSNTEKECKWNFKFQIERLFLEYNHSKYLNTKIGRFLTPLGIWNKIHIDALKWTVSDPLVSRKFFPMFTTGIQLFGYLSTSKKIKYELFVQKNESINSSYNNLKPDNMIGLQIEKIKDIHNKFGFNIGRFDEEISNERYAFIGLYGKTKLKKLYLSSEVFYANEKYKGINKHHRESGKFTYYLQSVYRVFSKNYFILRKDGLYDSSDDKHIDIWTFCWNFRPRFNVSFKMEYQLFERRDDYLRFSFSMLF